MFQGCIDKNCGGKLGKKTKILKYYLRIFKETMEENLVSFKVQKTTQKFLKFFKYFRKIFPKNINYCKIFQSFKKN